MVFTIFGGVSGPGVELSLGLSDEYCGRTCIVYPQEENIRMPNNEVHLFQLTFL